MGKGNDEKRHRTLAVFAHPDDESYGPGATLARLSAEGSEVRLITLTRGESASMGDSPLFSPEFLAETRTLELECASRALGLSGHRLFGFPDKALDTVPLEELAEPVIKELEEFRPHLVITFHPSGISGHPDHQCATRAAQLGLEVVASCAGKARGSSRSRHVQPRIDGTTERPTDRPAGDSNDRPAAPPEDEPPHTRLAYYVWPESVAAKITWRTVHTVPDDEVTHAIEIGRYIESKIEACHCHKTQRYLMERLSEFPGGIEALWTHEYFIVDGLRSTGSPRSSLIDGA